MSSLVKSVQQIPNLKYSTLNFGNQQSWINFFSKKYWTQKFLDLRNLLIGPNIFLVLIFYNKKFCQNYFILSKCFWTKKFSDPTNSLTKVQAQVEFIIAVTLATMKA